MKMIFSLIALCYLSSTHAQTHDYPFKTEVGDLAPSFDMVSLENKEVNISDYKGKVVVINLFATWCPPCMKEMPILNERLAKKYDDQDLAVLAIGYDHIKLELEYFKEDHDYAFEYVPDFGKNIFNLFADMTLPRNIVLDSSGKIIFQSVGYFPDELEHMIGLVEQEIGKE